MKKIMEALAVKERPILFSTPMVRAILEGRKTVTRRVKELEEINERPDDWTLVQAETMKRVGGDFYFVAVFRDGGEERVVYCPYGAVGDILWVRETFVKVKNPEEFGPLYIYKADHPDGATVWKPSIHMPKEACRLKLEIVSIGVERLQDITEEDAVKEGVEKDYYTPEAFGPKVWVWKNYDFEGLAETAKISFRSLWRNINGADSWEANPWCWRIEFKKL